MIDHSDTRPRRHRLPILIVRVPTLAHLEEREAEEQRRARDESLRRLRIDYHVVCIEKPRDAVNVELIGAGFWSQLLYYVFNRKPKPTQP